MFLALLALAFITPVFAQIAVTVAFGPPALPIYDQPICPGDGFLWTPGYWAYDPDDGYYWVPGTWVEAPEVGYLASMKDTGEPKWASMEASPTALATSARASREGIGITATSSTTAPY